MKVTLKSYSPENGWATNLDNIDSPQNCNLVIGFASPGIFHNPDLYHDISKTYPNAEILLASSAGEILGTEVNDNTLALTAIQFEKTIVKAYSIDILEEADSYAAGKKLAGGIPTEGLVNIFLISDGHLVNGSELIKGCTDHFPSGTIITGGMAGDSDKFEKTWVGLNEPPREGRVAALAFYGDHLKVTYGSMSGWDSFGPERLITKSKANILYELDGKPALDVYKTYLGDYAQELPGSALLFPLGLRVDKSGIPLIRTILSIDEDQKSLTFAGNIQEGSYARLMTASLDRIIEGASMAAEESHKGLLSPEIAILISCVGRKIVLNQRIEEEIEVVKSVFGDDTLLTGFYSYGEFSPSENFIQCELHNQTMTITTFTELKDVPQTSTTPD